MQYAIQVTGTQKLPHIKNRQCELKEEQIRFKKEERTKSEDEKICKELLKKKWWAWEDHKGEVIYFITITFSPVTEP